MLLVTPRCTSDLFESTCFKMCLPERHRSTRHTYSPAESHLPVGESSIGPVGELKACCAFSHLFLSLDIKRYGGTSLLKQQPWHCVSLKHTSIITRANSHRDGNEMHNYLHLQLHKKYSKNWWYTSLFNQIIFMIAY